MLKNTRLTKIIGTAALASFTITSLPCQVFAAGYLAPQSFSQMYNLARNGEVEALRASVRRGMNIDSLNENGDTGLCVAAQRRDAYTYNVFRASAANPRHPCTQKISHYNEFVNSSKTVSVTSTSREAYGKLGKEEYSVSPTTWWILGGLALGGGIAALALGGGGGGGGSGSDDDNYENQDSLGKLVGTSGSIAKKTTLSEINSKNYDLKNSQTDKIKNINFNKSVLINTEYMDAALKADQGGSFENAKNTILQLGSGVVGMVAENKASLINNGYINADAYNAAIGMVASGGSSAVNNGKGVIDGNGSNGIDMNFSGYRDTDMIIGMYADTNSSLVNNGDIQGSAILASTDETDTQGNPTDEPIGGDNPEEGSTPLSSSSVGSIVGMQTVIINAGSSLNKNIISAVNAGKIEISAGDGGTDNEIKVNIIGMSSALDDGFMNGSKNISRAEKSTLENTGSISLSYTGNYTVAAENTLRKGLGGVVGMRSDANTTAKNSGDITIGLTSDGSAGGIAVAAGMQSVHGGVIFNNADGKININTASDNARITYGMLSVEGSGTVSGLYVTNQNVQNDGTINMRASNSYGMASYNGGTLTNIGHIILGSDGNTLYNKNVGMYGFNEGSRVSLVNKGTIDVYSHHSFAMKNDYPGDTIIQNDGIINVYKDAVDSHVFGGKYSQIFNNGLIHYSATPTTTSAKLEEEGHFAVISTASEDNVTDSSTTQHITNNNLISVADASGLVAMAVETIQGTALNAGEITLNPNSQGNTINQVGMLLGSTSINVSSIINSGIITVYTKYSAAMVSYTESTASVINKATGRLNIHGDNSYGIYSTGNSFITNEGIIALYGKDTIGIYSAGYAEEPNKPEISNEKIIIYGEDATAFYIDGKVSIKKIGAVELCDPGSPDCKENAGDNLVYFYVTEKGEITLTQGLSMKKGTLVSLNGGKVTIDNGVSFTLYGNGTLIKGNGGTFINNGYLNIFGSESYGINLSADTIVNNNGEINIKPAEGTTGESNYGIYSSNGGTITSSGKINVVGNSSAAIYIQDGNATINTSGPISVTGDNSYGIYAPTSETITNSSTITIIGSGNTGITGGNGNTVDNSGEIIIKPAEGTAGESNYGIYSSTGGTITSTGNISIDGDSSAGIYVESGVAGTNNATEITNLADIIVTGSDSYGIYSASAAEISNTGEITVKPTAGVIGESNYGIYSGGGMITSQGNISIDGNSSAGIYVQSVATDTDKAAEITNSAKITVTGDDSSGIYSAKEAEISNTGEIIITSTAGAADTTNYGIYGSGGTITNETSGKITVSGNKSIGIYLQSGTAGTSNKAEIINRAILDITGDTGCGICAIADATIQNYGKITVNAGSTDENNYGIYSNSGTITNENTITVYGDKSGAIYVKSGGDITNSAALFVTGNNSYGIYAPSSNNITNSSTITLIGNSNYGINGGNGNITNSATISVTGNYSYGIYATGKATITNTGAITIAPAGGITGNANFGIYSNGGSVENENGGYITIKGNNSAGIYATGTAEISNKADITLTGNKSYGIFAPSSNNITNSSAITLNGGENTGIKGGSNITNSALIYITGNNSYGISTNTQSTINNTGEINITPSSGNSNYGIYSSSGASITSGGKITINGNNSAGIYVQSGSGEITNSAPISVTGNNSNGIYVQSGNGEITNSASISVIGDNSNGIYAPGSNITNGSTITVTGSGNTGITGGNKATIENSGTITVSGNNSIGINALTGSNITNGSSIIVTGAGSYGIKNGTGGGTIENGGTITVSGGGNYGVYAASGNVNNSADISVTDGSNNYGVYAASGNVNNTANITVSGGSNNYGIYTEGGASANNNGTINVSGANSYGMFASGVGGTVVNNSTIIISGSDSYGMFATDEGVATNNGTISASGGALALNGNVKDNTVKEEEGGEGGEPPASLTSLLMAKRSGVVRNTGTIITDQKLDFNQSKDDTGIIEINQNGNYQAASFSGTVTAGADITQNGFDKSYKNTNSFIGKDDGLSVASGSYLFNAEKQLNEQGNIDVVMTMKSFDEVLDNKNLVNFLNSNYTAEKGEEIFNVLKEQRNESLFNQAINEQFGFNIVANFAKQNLDILQTVNRNMNDDLINVKDEAVRRQIKAFNYKQEVDSKHNLMGYKDKISGIYGFYDEKINNNLRLGYGLSALRAESDYDNDSSRYNNVVEFFAPLIGQKDNTSVMVKAKAGFGRGHYRRQTSADTYKANTEEYYYGVDTAARYTVDLNIVDVEPEVGFNITGMYQDDIHESKNGLRIKGKNTVSTQSVIGLDIKKKIEFNHEHSLSVAAGGKYYHEFGDKYRTKATVGDMNGFYDITDIRMQRNYGLLSLKAKYEYKNMSIDASANVPLTQKHNAYYLFGLGYKF